MTFMEHKNWKRDLAGCTRNRAALENRLVLEKEERAFFEDPRRAETLPFRVTDYYLSLISDDPKDPLRRQFVPTAGEFHILPYETGDPLFEERFTPVPRLVRRYPDRALLKVNDTCAVYCRHCFRRDFTGRAAGALTDTGLGAACDYLRRETEVKELLLSGGDPLLLDTRRLESILGSLRKVRPDVMFRLATRVPVTLPSRVDESLAAMLAEYFPLWVVTQFNHPREITQESTAAMRNFILAGLPCVNQTVLLKGVNDNAGVLGALFRGLVNIGVKPYYLFQGDLAAGTGHFRTSIRTGWKIMEELRSRVSGLAVPVYAVDLPGGGGKIPLERGRVVEETTESYAFRNMEGNVYTYPKEEP